MSRVAMSSFTMSDTLSKMEEARVEKSNDSNEEVVIIVDKQLSIREKAIFNTKSLIPVIKNNYVKPLFSNENVKCDDCCCDMEKDSKLRDENGYYYCSECWNEWVESDEESIRVPAFTENWIDEYEKPEYDY